MKLVNPAQDSIDDVTLLGVEAIDALMLYHIVLRTDDKTEDSAEVILQLYAADEEEEEVDIVLEDCIQLCNIPDGPINAEGLRQICSANGSVLDRGLTALASVSATIEVRGLPQERLRFTVTIGPHYRTELTVDARTYDKFFRAAL